MSIADTLSEALAGAESQTILVHGWGGALRQKTAHGP
jgi:hypothetical protein